MIFRAHFIWYQGQPPERYAETIEDFKTLNPDFTVYIWDETKLLELLPKNPIFQRAIDQAPYIIQKIDIYKYIVLYLFGGIYMDLDVSFHKPFDNQFIQMINQHEVVFSNMRVYSLLPFKVVNNGIIIANQVKSLVFIDIIRNIPWNKMTGKNKDWAILETTGPFYLTGRMESDKRVLILPEHYLEGRPLVPWLGAGEGIYTTHLHHSNWMERWLYLWIFLLKYIVGVILLGLYIYLK
jgi:mannosyltransferase OCH1-like enzyme